MKKTDLLAIFAGVSASSANSSELSEALVGAAAAVAVYLARRLIDWAVAKFGGNQSAKDSENNP